MKKTRMTWGLAALLLSLGTQFMGCSNPSGGDAPKSDDAALSSLTVKATLVAASQTDIALERAISGTTATVTATLGTPATTWNAATLVAGKVVLPSNTNFGKAMDVSAVKHDGGATVTLAKVTGTGTPNFGSSSSLTFATGDFLYVKVVSASRSVTKVYKILVSSLTSDSTATEISVGGQVTGLGTPAATWNDAALVSGKALLTAAQATNAAVAVKTLDPLATAQYAKVSAADAANAPVFGDVSQFTFALGDLLYVKVVSSDATTTTIYKVEVLIDANTELKTLSVNATAVSTLPTASSTLADAVPLDFLLNIRPTGAWDVAATTTDAGATVKFAKATGNAVPAFAALTSFTFAYGDYLYVEVTALNGVTKAYYKLHVLFQNSVQIQWGRPVIGDNTIDPVWDNVLNESLPISKIYVNDSPSATWRANPDTTATAKVLWDYDGIYVLVQVTDPNVTQASSSAWLQDSVEIFLDENRPETGASGGYANDGGQYRVSAFGKTSGDPAGAATALTTLNRYSAWTTPTGYVVEMQAPFRWVDRNIVNGTRIGFELQVNACTGSARDGVLVWNNVGNSNYQNVTNYGVANLVGMPAASEVSVSGITVAGSALPTVPAGMASFAEAKSQVVNLTNGTNFTVSAASALAGVTFRYGTSADATTVPTDWASSTILTVPTGGYVGIEATSADGLSKKFYKFQVAYGATDTTLLAGSKVTIHGKLLDLATPAATYADATTSPIYLTAAQIGSAVMGGRILATATDPAATVEYGVDNGTFSWTTWSTVYTGPTTWYTAASTATASFSNGGRIVVRVTAGDKVTQGYYVYKVTQAAAAALTSPTLTADTAAVTVTAGTPSTTWNGPALVAGTVTLTATQAAAVTAFTGGANGTTPTYRYALVHTGDTGAPSFGTTLPASLANGDSLYVEVTANDASANVYVNVYKIDVTVN